MKILITTVGTDMQGGVASFFQAVLPQLREEVLVCRVGSREYKSWIGAQIARMLGDWLRLARCCFASEIKLVHLNPSLGPKALLRDGVSLLLAKLFRKHVLVFIHGWDETCEANIRRRWRWAFKCVYGGADAFIVLASDFGRRLRELGIEKPVHGLTTTLDASIFSSEPRLCGDTFNVLFLSRIEEDKGIFLVLEAFRELKQWRADATLTVAGTGDALEAAEAWVRERALDGVTFAGFVRGAAKESCFREADVFFFPTCYGEGMPIAVLEAMAYGLPVVTRPVGGLADFFQNDVMGYCSDTRDPDDFAQMLRKLALGAELRTRQGAFNRAYATEHFAPDRVADRLRVIYALTLGG